MAIKTASNRKTTSSSTLSSAYSSTVIIRQVVITDLNYDALDDTAVSSAGGYIKIFGIGFMSGYSLYYNGIAVATSTLISSNEIRAVIPSIANGTYNLTLFNSNNTGALYVLTASGFPTWSTSTYISTVTAINIQLLATGDAPLTYSLQNGSTLPTGITLTSTGVLTGTATSVISDSVFYFTVIVDDAQLQSTQQAITLTFQFGDPYFKYTTLLLNGETSVTSFINDASTNSFALTIAGDTKPILFNPYQGDGYYSNYFDGTGDYLTITSNATLAVGTADFTVECWVYPQTTTQFTVLYLTSTFQIFVFNGALYWNDGTQTSGGTIVLNTWQHIAVSRSGTALRGFVNGAQVITTTSSVTLTQGTNYIGYNGGTVGQGHISNLRLVNGTALYTSTFTPSTTPLTAIANTQLLTCQSNRLIDNSTNTFSITKAGDVSVSPAIPFTANSSYSTYGSAYFDGTGDWLTAPDNDALDLGSSNFTVEGWFYQTGNLSTSGGGTGLVTKWTDASNQRGWQFAIRNAASTVTFYYSTTGSDFPVVTFSSVTLTSNTWTHFALVRSGNTLNLYKDGALAGTSAFSSTIYNSTSPLAIGAWFGGSAGVPDTAGGNSLFQGYISNVRVVNGTAVYTATFTPPTTPLTAITNTSLLTCQYNGGATNQAIIDNGPFNNIITRNGNTSQGSFSPYSVTGWSNYFNGSSDFMSSSGGVGVGGTSFGYGTGDFTWEMWVFPVSSTWTTGNFYFMDHGSNGGVLQYNVNVFRYYNGATAYDSAVGLIPVGVWTHIAVSRISGMSTTYVNGAVAKAATSDTGNYGTSQQLWIARYGAGGQYFPGYISNLRIVKGVGVYTGVFTPSTTPLNHSQLAGTNIAAITNQTSLLICQSNRFVNNSLVAISYDSGTTFNIGGTPSVQAFSPFGSVPEAVPISYSNFFDGTGDYLTLPSGNASIQPASSDFTIEAWVYPAAFVANGNPVAAIDVNATYYAAIRFGYESAGAISLLMSTNGTTWSINTASGLGTLTLNTWQHMAVSKSGTSVRVFLNGVQQGSTQTLSSATLMTGTNNWIGYLNAPSAQYVNGYISNWRLTKTALYTTTFTPSTTPLTAIANTSLLTCQSTTMIDNSTNRFTITANGDVKPKTFNPFGYTAQTITSYTPSTHGGSAYFDGTGDYLVCPAIANVSGTGYSWTVQGWFYPLAISAGGIVDGWNGGVGSSLLIRISSGTLQGHVTGGSSIVSAASSIITNQWYHFALVKNVDNSNTIQLYLNGVKVGTPIANYTSSITSNIFGIGGNTSTGGEGVTGYLSDIQIIKGIALYTSNFIPPTTSLTATANTSLLLNFNNGGIVDQHGSVVLETVGNTQLSTAVKKYGSSSMYFDGTGDSLKIIDNPNINLGSGDFTLECWVYFNVVNTEQVIFSKGWQSSSAYASYLIYMTSGASLRFGASTNGGSWDIANEKVMGTMTSGSWIHIAVTRSGTSFRAFINGVINDSFTFTSSSFLANIAAQTLFIGGRTDGNSILNGYIDDLRITKGYARYTANFTAPIETLSGQ